MFDAFTATGGGQIVLSLPEPLGHWLAQFTTADPDAGTRHTGAPVPVRVPGGDGDMFAKLEAEMVTDRLRAADAAHRSDVTATATRVLAELTRTGSATLSRDDARGFAQWLNRWYFRLRSAELGEVEIGGEQTSFVFGDEDEDDAAAMSPPTLLFAALHEELEELLDGPVEP